uniref:HTH CENPB-type domain-containing protein n=1 Tax=Gopherus agassizii TaxID=38772 RepID=A0A452GJZ5_9SAUR
MGGKCLDGMSVSNVAHKYGCNESKIRQAVASSAPITAKVTSQVRDKTLVKTEKALNLWLEDMNRKCVPIDGNTFREKALSLYVLLKSPAEEGQLSDEKKFKASQDWLNSFRNRFNLKNVHIIGETASANEEAAKAYPAQLKKIIEEKGYLLEQVFNADETGLFWKKMPNCTYISKSEGQAPGFKAAKDCMTVLFCGNAAGHLKPGLLYRATNPCALKGKNKNLLPVFWQSNKKAWVTAALFLDWFHKCFIPEVKRNLEEKGLDFKVLLIVDNAPGHPVALRFPHNDVEVVFLPPNTTSILQPLNQDMICCFKATYTRLKFSQIYSAMDADPNLNVMECWKSFNIADCITYIKQAMDAIKPETVNACWRNLWKECVNEFKGFPTIDKEVKCIVQVARQVGGDVFVDILEEEIEELIESHRETLTNKELEELIKSSTDDKDDDDEEEEPASWNLHKFLEVFQAVKHLNDLISEYNSSMERSLKITSSITDDLRPYQEMFQQLKRQQ